MKKVKIGIIFIMAALAAFLIFFRDSSAQDNSAITMTVKVSVCSNDIKESGEQCDNNDFGGKYCTDFGFSGGSLSCIFSCEYSTASCTTAAENSNTFVLTSSAGGNATISNADNTSVSIDLPSNFYSSDAQLKTFSYDNDYFTASKPAPASKDFIGKTYDLVFIDDNGNTVSAISQPATIILNYLEADVSGYDESSLRPYRWGSADSSWELISGATVDTADNTVTFSTAAFSSFALFGSAQSSSPACGDSSCNGSETCSSCRADCGACSSGGGGGGSSYVAPVTSATFSGRAYPISSVTLLKDAQIAATTIAGADANFQITLSGLSAGNYIFSVYSEDNKGNRSSLLTFPVSVTSGAATQVSGIFIAPTIAVDKSEVKRGDNIAIFGQSVSGGEIIISINSDEEFFGKVKADVGGAYLYNFDTSALVIGQHLTKSKAALDGAISSFGKVVSFAVGEKNVAAEPEKEELKGELNNDGRVNLIDFSIVAYWYKRPNPPAKVDLNGDGKINLVDFSIMAYYWTG